MKILKAKFIEIPKLSKNDIEQTTQEEFNKVFGNMLGHKYCVYKSEFNNEYVILEGDTEEAEKEYEESIYKSLIALGEDEEYARKVARGEEATRKCPNCGAKLKISKASINGHLWITCEKEGVLICQ